MHATSLKIRRQAGDTIIEVLIAIAVVSLVLAGAYAITNRSTLVTQDTQEHSQALQLVKRQVEFLRQAKTIPVGKTCFDTTGTATSGAACRVGSDGNPTTLQPVYTLDIAPGAANGCTRGNNYVYGVQAQWNSLLGGNSTVTICYEVYNS